MITTGRYPKRRLDGALITLGAIVVGGLALRLWRLGGQSFWYDEAQTLFVSRFPYGEIIQRAYRPPLYHFLLHLWDLWVPDSEFWLRLPSALFGAAVVPLSYFAASRLYDRRTGLLAAALAALSPTLVYYAQELRMYSLMALEFLLLLYLFTALALEQPARRRRGLWTALFLVEVASLYTHYFAIPFLVWLAVVAGLVLLATRRWCALGAWLAVQVASAIAFIPWLFLIRSGRGGTGDYLAAETPPVVTSVPGVREMLAQSWWFYTTNVAPIRGSLLWRLSPVAAFVLGVAILVLLARAVGARRRAPASGKEAGHLSDACLLALIGGPLITAIVMYKLRPGVVHPRHMMMIAGPLVILLGRLGSLALSAWRPRRPGLSAWVGSLSGHLVGLATLLAFGSLFLGGLVQSYRDPAAQRPDVRSLARRIAAMTTANDMVLFPYIDYAFDYYFPGPAHLYHLETRVGDVDLAGWLMPRATQARRAVLVRWVHVFADGRDFLPWLLQTNGRLVQQGWEAERWVSVYDLPGPLALPALAPTRVRVDPLLLSGVHFLPTVPADQPVPVALLWQVVRPTSADYKASVRVLDPAGIPIAADDRILLSEGALAPTSHWRTGAGERNYHFLKLPPGTPPLTYTLSVSVYQGQTELDVLNLDGAAIGTSYRLGSFRVEPPASFLPDFPASIPMVKVGREVAPGLRLEGYALDRSSLRPGETLGVTLYWKADQGSLPAYEPQLRIISEGGKMVASQAGQPAYGQYPCSRWRPGELVTDRRQVPVPPEAEAGQAHLELAIDGQIPLALQTVTVEQADRRFILPPVQHRLEATLGDVARLRGFDLDSASVKAGEPVRLTLYWEAINDAPVPVGYAVFTHLLDPNNQVIAQHDGQPEGGHTPTTTWVKGQIIIDRHELTWKDGNYRGEAVLEVGLYNPQSFQRLATPEGEDRVLLPVKVEVK